MTTTRIILTALSEQKLPYIGVFDHSETFYPRTHENGALKEEEYGFLIAMARLAVSTGKVWLPADSHRDTPGCFVPYWLTEAIWAGLDAGPRCYYKFTFNPPLEIVHPLPDISDPYR